MTKFIRWLHFYENESELQMLFWNKREMQQVSAALYFFISKWQFKWTEITAEEHNVANIEMPMAIWMQMNKTLETAKAHFWSWSFTLTQVCGPYLNGAGEQSTLASVRGWGPCHAEPMLEIETHMQLACSSHGLVQTITHASSSVFYVCMDSSTVPHKKENVKMLLLTVTWHYIFGNNS